MEPDFIEKVCSVCEKSIRMKNSYGIIGVHCTQVNAPNYQASKYIKRCPLGKVIQ